MKKQRTELDLCMLEWVKRNHRENLQRERLEKANRQVAIKENIMGLFGFLMIMLFAILAGAIEVSAAENTFATEKTYVVMEPENIPTSVKPYIKGEIGYYGEYCIYNKANDEFVRISDGEAWSSPKGTNVYGITYSYSDGSRYWVTFCDKGTENIYDDWIRQISNSKY